MEQILIYGDSLSWGIIPGTRNRFAFYKRWPGVMENALLGRGHDVRVIEDCLNGRTTSIDDPSRPGRNGLVGIEQRIESCSPLTLVMVFLGTNDFQSVHMATAKQAAASLRQLVEAIRRAPVEPGMPHPEILLISPPPIRSAADPIQSKFAGARERSAGSSGAVQDAARLTGCQFFNAANVTPTSSVDGVHLDADQHRELGIAMAEWVTLRSGHDGMTGGLPGTFLSR